MPKVITSIGDTSDLGCCILGLRDAGMNAGTMDEMMGIAGADDDSFSIVNDPADPAPAVSDFDPVFIPATGPVALAIPEPGPGGSLTVKGAGWSRGDGTYIVQHGDTLSGLSRIYLGNAARFREIWNIQSSSYRASRGSPDNLVVGDLLVMPNEAVLKAKAMGVFTPKVPSGSSSPSSPKPPPPAPVATAPVPKPAAATPPSHKTALGIGSALAAGVGLLLWRTGSSAHPAPKKRQRQRRRRR
jgi:hypothetical protein